MRARAAGAVQGCLLADAAAMGVHWVYDLDQLASMERAALEAEKPDGLAFTDPPRSPFYAYPSGHNSP